MGVNRIASADVLRVDPRDKLYSRKTWRPSKETKALTCLRDDGLWRGGTEKVNSLSTFHRQSRQNFGVDYKWVV